MIPKTTDVSRFPVSIVTVSLNAVGTIEDTLRSVCCQNAPFPVEHICVDGGSTDGTRDVIDRFAALNPFLKRVYEPDKGLFDAMNKGVRESSGEYILFLNADDFLVSEQAISDVIGGALLQPTNPDMVLGDVVMGHLDRFGIYRHRRVPGWLLEHPRSGVHPPHQGLLVKRSLLLEIGGFDSASRLSSDTVMFYRLMQRFSPSLYRPQATLSFMRSGGASSNGFGSLARGNWETYRLLRQFKSPLASALAVGMKIGQKFLELRLGRLSSSQFLWFKKVAT